MSKAWYDDSEQLEGFYEDIADEMIVRRYLRKRPDSAISNDAVRDMMGDFISEVSPISRYDTSDECTSAVVAWLDDSAASPVLEGQRIEATITRTFGDIQMTFGYSAIFEVGSAGQRRSAFAFCIDQVEKQFEAHTSNIVVTSRGPQPPVGNGSSEKFMGDKIVVETKGDKVYYKITGGKWSKYGVRVWPEVLGNFGIKTDKLKAGTTYNLARWCTVDMDGDKPIKVTHIADG